jgi:hypothetical protein
MDSTDDGRTKEEYDEMQPGRGVTNVPWGVSLMQCISAVIIDKDDGGEKEREDIRLIECAQMIKYAIIESAKFVCTGNCACPIAHAEDQGLHPGDFRRCPR